MLPSAAYADTTPPRIIHDIVTEQVVASKPYEISATVTDSDSVAEVVLFFKYRDGSEFKSIPMTMESGDNLYKATLPASELVVPGIDYFISATDASGNQQFRGFDFDPLQLTVYASLPIPSEEEPATNSGSNRTVWYIVGAVVAVGFVAGLAGEDDSPPPEDTTTFVFQR